MRRIFREEYLQKKAANFGLEQTKQAEKEELDRLLALNDERNKKLAEER